MRANHNIDLLAVIASSIDPADPTPVYHQVAAVIRWEVARGRIPIGTHLPPIRKAAEALGINYHTVRRAWGELEDEGVITQRRGRGARVVRAPSALAGWRPDRRDDRAGDGPPMVWVVDRWLERAARLAARLVERWHVTAVPYPGDSATPPPPGAILLLDHPGDAALPWPEREGDTSKVELTLDPDTVTLLRRNARLLDTGEVVLVSGDGDPSQPARELLRQLPRVGLRARQAGPAAIDPAATRLWLHLPLAWQQLGWHERSLPHVMAVEFDWAPGPLAGVARRLGWAASGA